MYLHLQQLTLDVLPRTTKTTPKCEVEKWFLHFPKRQFKRARQAQWQHDVNSKHCTQTVAVVFVQRSWAGLHFERFCVQFFCDVRDFVDSPCPDTRHASQMCPQVCEKKKKNRVSALMKSVDCDQSEKCVPRLQERLDVPRLIFTHYSV